MGFNLNRGLTAVSTGGLSEAARLFDTGMTTQEQVPLETPEQRAARLKLAEFMNTGKFGNFTAGADIGIKPGDYNMTGLEKTGQSELQKLLSSGIPSQFSLGDKALADILNPNPNSISASFDPFKQQTERQIAESNTALKRGAGFAGNLYSTNTIKGLGDIQARGNETLTAELARLTNQALDRRLQATSLAYQSGTAQENIIQNRIGASQQYGGLQRDLSNAGTAEANAELLRRRNELLLPINTATNIAGTNANFGVPSVSVQNPNPLLDLLTAVISGGSKIAAAK